MAVEVTGRAPKDARHRLDGQVAIVTGGGNGIGRACAVEFAARGANVIVADVREEDAVAVAAEVTSQGSVGVGVRCDVGHEPDVEAMVAAAVDRFARVDALVTSAGVFTTIGQIHELTLSDWDLVIRVNLTGTFLAIKHALGPMLRAGRGSIVTIGSTSSVVAGPGPTAGSYQASKGGVLQLTRQVAVRYAEKGIRANCVCPGSVSTHILDHVAQSVMPQATTRSESPLVRANSYVPMHRSAEPSEVAQVVAFLASDQASFVTGTAVMVDGGATAI